MKKELERAKLRGAALILDFLWEGSNNRCGKENSEMIEDLWKRYFGENWSSHVWKFLDTKGQRVDLDEIKTLKELK